jgi:hypothetical protein
VAGPACFFIPRTVWRSQDPRLYLRRHSRFGAKGWPGLSRALLRRVSILRVYLALSRRV